MDYLLEEYNEDVLEEIYNLEVEIFGRNAYKKEQIREMLESPEYKIFIFKELNKKIVSYLIVYDSFDIYEIMKIGVREKSRKKGYGTILLNDFIKKYNKGLLLEVRESNLSAIKFYEKNDFKKISIRKNYYCDNGENAIIMKLNKK